MDGKQLNNELCHRFSVFKTENVPPPIVVFNCAINIPLLLATIIGNSLVLSTVWRTPCLHSPSSLFLCSLAASDLTVGFIIQPIFILIELLNVSGHQPDYFCDLANSFFILAFTLCGASLGTIIIISIDRFLALHYHMRYSHIVTVLRVRYVILLSWMTSGMLSTLLLWNVNLFLIILVSVVSVCLSVATAVHLKIYRVVLRHRRQILAQEIAVYDQGSNNFNMMHFKKSLANTFVVYYFLLLCYSPFFIALLMQVFAKVDQPVVWKLANTTIYFNSAVNPVLYCWRLQRMRAHVLQTLRKVLRMENSVFSPE